MGQIAERTVRTLDELVAAVTPAAADPGSGRRRSYSIYRGSGDARRALLTSIDRLGGVDPPHTKVRLEEHILRNFIRYSRPYLDAQPANEWELLFTAQHHGLPTRLLDWSYSPLVAAHFATLEPTGHDVAIWRLDWRRVHERFGLRPLAFLVADLEAALAERGVRSVQEFFHAPEALAGGFACMLEPPATDARIVAQSAAFTLCSDASRSFDAFLEQHGLADALERLVIPAACVAYVRDQLDICAIDERRLFPDLDGVARVVRRYYDPSPGAPPDPTP